MMKNKNLVLIPFLLLLFSIFAFAENVRLLSFNINGVPEYHREENQLWVNQICVILKESKADIILLQEFPMRKGTSTLAEKFKRELPNSSKWEYFCTDKYIKKGTPFNQNSIVFYNTTKIFADPKSSDKSELYNSKYNFDKNNYQIIEFALKSNQKNKFVLCNVHLPFDRKNEWQKYFSDVQELSKLYKEFSSKKVIVAGDFNTYREMLVNNVNGTHFSEKSVIDFEYYAGRDGKKSLLTTVDKKNSSFFKLVSDYDHFIVSKKIKIIKGMRHAIPSYKDSEPNLYNEIKIGGEIYNSGEEFEKGISDHLPVMIDVEI